ncbi:MAG: hypothetical protein H6736_22025 [Alphaproteobacteria bacterium]|nr:hypothetical protein [Alphaproteobacteria bacterium]
MGVGERVKLYKQMEELRGRPMLAYVTSARQGASGQMAADVVPELLAQLQHLPGNAKALDLLIASQGGDPTVAWRIVSLLRERVESFSVLVPQAAFSAATLLALGADEIVMHPHANLGPVDPQITVARPPANGTAGPGDAIRFGSEDLDALLDFARERVGLRDQDQLVRVFEMVCGEVGTVPVGVASRSSSLSMTMGEKLLLTHMKDDTDHEKARAIAQALNKNYFHHGYPVSRSEAKELGLKVVYPPTDVEKLLWEIWLDMEAELELRAPFNPIGLLRQDPGCAALFAPVSQVNLPAGLPQAIAQQIMLQHAAQSTISTIPPTKYSTIAALCESSRWATRHVSHGSIVGARMPDLTLRVSQVQEHQGWMDMDLSATCEYPVDETAEVRDEQQ